MPSPGRLPRRSFLTAAAAGVGGVVVASLRPGGRSAPPDTRALVLVDLAGGNDGLGTVVPMGDERYRRLRGRLALGRAEVRRPAPGVGLHPALPRLADRYAKGGVAIVEGVGSAPAGRTHEDAADAADAVEVDPVRTGWLGRLADAGLGCGPEPALVSLGAEGPPAFAARAAVGERSAGPANLVSFQVFVDGLLEYEQRDVYEADSAFENAMASNQSTQVTGSVGPTPCSLHAPAFRPSQYRTRDALGLLPMTDCHWPCVTSVSIMRTGRDRRAVYRCSSPSRPTSAVGEPRSTCPRGTYRRRTP